MLHICWEYVRLCLSRQIYYLSNLAGLGMDFGKVVAIDAVYIEQGECTQGPSPHFMEAIEIQVRCFQTFGQSGFSPVSILCCLMCSACCVPYTICSVCSHE